MRAFLLVLLVACGGATPAASTPGSSTAETRLDLSPTEPAPDDIHDHQHVAPAHTDDPDKLYVEVSSDGDHGPVLVQSATAGLATVPYAVSVEQGGDLELHVEIASLAAASGATACKVKIFALRLPQHDLLAIADGGARATGAGQADTCLSTIGTKIVTDKLPTLFQRQLAAKR